MQRFYAGLWGFFVNKCPYADGNNFQIMCKRCGRGNQSENVTPCNIFLKLMLAYSSNYFRLKIVSIDENITYSKIIILYNEKCGGSPPIVALVKTNPVVGHSLAISVVLSKTDNLEIKISGMSGNLIPKYNLPATQGKNEMNLDVPVTAHGQYILNVFSSINGSVSKKIVVE
jgi:hypothetical protein